MSKKEKKIKSLKIQTWVQVVLLLIVLILAPYGIVPVFGLLPPILVVSIIAMLLRIKKMKNERINGMKICIECNKEIAEDIEKCPNCGYSEEEAKASKLF